MKILLSVICLLLFVSIAFGQDTELVLVESFPDYDDNSSEDYLDWPSDIIYHDNLYYIADGMDANIKVFSGEGKFVRQIGTKGRGPGELLQIYNIALDKENGILYCNDVNNNRISIFSKEGDFMSSFRVDRSVSMIEFINGTIYMNFYNAVDKTLFAMFDTDGKIIKNFGEFFESEEYEPSVAQNLYEVEILVDREQLYAIYKKIPFVDIYNLNGELKTKIEINVPKFQDRYAENVNNARVGWIDLEEGGRSISILSLNEGVVVENEKLYYQVRVKPDEINVYVINMEGDLERTIPFRVKPELPITHRLREKSGDMFVFVDIIGKKIKIYQEQEKKQYK